MLNLQIRLLLIALRTWTRLLGHGPETAHRGAVRSTRYAPLVGLFVAVPASLAYALAGLWLPHPVALLAALAAGTLLTGAMHERGFAALCDAGAPAATPGVLGAAGAVGLPILLLARFETLSALDPSWIALCLLCGAALSRGCAVLVMTTLPPATTPPWPESQGAARGGPGTAPGGLELGVAGACAAVPLAAAVAWTGEAGVFATGLAAALLAAMLVRRIAQHRLGGCTDAVFGATQQLAELAFHLGVLATLALADETPADSSP